MKLSFLYSYRYSRKTDPIFIDSTQFAGPYTCWCVSMEGELFIESIDTTKSLTSAECKLYNLPAEENYIKGLE